MTSKWWENYLVRYALGFVFALAFSFFLLNKLISYADLKGLEIIKNALAGNNSNISLFILIPIAASICYISAAPIIVLHTGRYRRGLVDRLSRNFWYAWLVYGALIFIFRNDIFFLKENFYCFLIANIVVLLISWVISNFSADKSFVGWKDFWFKVLFIVCLFNLFYLFFSINFIFPLSDDFSYLKIQFSWIYLSLPAFWIFIGQYSVLHRLLKNEDGFYDFYKNLTEKRSVASFNEARETYSHLREHSNAFFIVAVEISLFSFVIFLINFFEMKNIPKESQLHIFHIIIFGLVSWVVPAIFMWSTANRLEKKFCE